MLLLTSTSDKVQVVTDQAVAVDVHASFVDNASGTITPGRTNTAISTATTTDVVAPPGASTQRNVKTIHVRNKDATTTVNVTVKHTDGTTAVELVKFGLGPGEQLEYVEGVGFFKVAADNSNRLLTNAETTNTQRLFAPRQLGVGTFLLISGTAYFVYVGRITQDITVKFLEFHVSTAGAGAQTAEVGLYTSTQPPNKSAQTLTKLAATGTVDSTTTTGVKRNTSTFAQAVTAGTHLWAAIRTAMATTQPTLLAGGADLAQGTILTTTGGGALTGVSSASGAIVTAVATAHVPWLVVTLD